MLDRGEADETQDEVAQDRQVVRGMIGADPHLVVGKSRLHAPVQAVFGTPVHANALIHVLGVRRQAADISAPSGRFSQLRLIVLGCEDAVRSPVANGLRHGRLRTHGGQLARADVIALFEARFFVTDLVQGVDQTDRLALGPIGHVKQSFSWAGPRRSGRRPDHGTCGPGGGGRRLPIGIDQ